VTAMEIISLAGYGIRSALGDRRRSGWLLAGILLGLAFFVIISTLGNGYRELVELPFSRLKSDLLVQLGTQGSSREKKSPGGFRLPFSNQPITAQQSGGVARIPGVVRMTPSILLWYQERKKFITLAGIDPQQRENGPAAAMGWITAGRAPKTRGEAVAESHYARFNRLRLGQKLQLGKYSLTIVGITTIREGASLAAANLYILLDEAREMAAMAPGAANLLALELAGGVEKKSVQGEIRAVLPTAIISSADSIGDMMRGFAGISDTATRLLTATGMGFTLLLVCWLIAGRLQEQRRQLGLMRCMGWRKGEILLSCTVEALVISLIGGLGGICLGLLVVRLCGALEVSLPLPWNLAPTPKGMQHHSAGSTMLLPLPLHPQAAAILRALALTCLAAVLTASVTAARLVNRGVRHTLFDQSPGN